MLAMTSVGGLMWLIQGAPRWRAGARTWPAAVISAGAHSFEPIFRTRTPIVPGRWQAIVIHHSGSMFGTPASLEAQHRAIGLAGLGDHFIVGNGAGMDDGEIHVGFRWLNQLPGAHTAGPQGDWFNRHAIGVCLVGDGRRRPFTDEQIRRLGQLVRELSRRLQIPPERVYLHSDVAPVDDPGRYFPEAMLRASLPPIR